MSWDTSPAEEGSPLLYHPDLDSASYEPCSICLAVFR